MIWSVVPDSAVAVGIVAVVLFVEVVVEFVVLLVEHFWLWFHGEMGVWGLCNSES